MGPYEFAALCMVVPIVLLMVWVTRRFEADGVPVPEFEQWCQTNQPVVFALRCARGHAAAVVHALGAWAETRMQVDHHRGRYPWTRYVFELALELDPLQEVVVDRVVRCALRRGQQRRPELGAMLDRVTREHGEKLVEVWMHAELREDDDQAGIERRERGWVALVEHGARGPLLATNGPPAWAQVSRAAA